MPRAVWTGTISFGLVTIPVRLYPATSPKDVRFHLVDDRGARVHLRRYVEADETEPGAGTDVDTGTAEGSVGTAGRAPGEREVAFEGLQRGFETDEGMVVVSPEEIDAVRPSPSRVIAIEDFVDLADIDPMYFEKSYIVSARGEAAKPYALLLRAMERSGRAGIGRFVLRTKPHLAVIRPARDVLALETMFFADEVRDGRSLAPDVESVGIADKEVELAQVLIETLKTDWDPTRYEDMYRRELLERIAEKRPVPGVAPLGSDPAGARIDELLEALKASVDEAKKTKARTGKRSA
ncbi:MAG TPA: Ku protein [Actinomycetota bacterium]|jgi:DNA end-binding protein Ku|nr:Ku protein [Actinomycetota bacterium]